MTTEAEIKIMWPQKKKWQHHQKLRKARNEISLRTSEGRQPRQHLDLIQPASRTVKEYVVDILSHQGYGNLL